MTNLSNVALWVQQPRKLGGLLFCVGTLLTLLAADAKAQSADCRLYELYQGSGEPIPRDQLINWKVSTDCLMDAMREMTRSERRYNDNLLRQQFITVGKAQQYILAQFRDPAIEYFRQHDDLRVAATLTNAAIYPEKAVRVLGTTILANVIADDTLCVPLDYLFDPDLDPNGRTNLLGVVSVAAEWAAPKNKDNIRRMIDSLKSKFDLSASFVQSKRLIDKIQDGLDHNRQAGDDGTIYGQCSSYTPIWAGENLKY